MPLIVPSASRSRLLEQITNKTAVQNWVLRLFTNNYTPVAGSVAADFTQATGSGYVALTLTASEWVEASQEIIHPPLGFAFTGALGNVYGYYVTELTSALLICAERFSDAPKNITASGQVLVIELHVTLA